MGNGVDCNLKDPVFYMSTSSMSSMLSTPNEST